MVAGAIRKIVEQIDDVLSTRSLGAPYLGEGYVADRLEATNFHPVQDTKTKGRIAFVDGGNREILSAPTFSVQANRVYFNLFHGDTRTISQTTPHRVEFLSGTTSSFRDGEIHYDTHITPVDPESVKYLPDPQTLSFNSLDREVMEGRMRADISRVASIARRFAEWTFSQKILEEELDEGDMLVVDGTLKAAFKREIRYIDFCMDTAAANGVVFTGLSKTSRIYTDTGQSLLAAIQRLAQREQVTHPTWYYHPVAQIVSPELLRRHRAEIFIIKLNQAAERIFRLEVFDEQVEAMTAEELNHIFSMLAENSSDITFPGYPYGLIDADRHARVTEDQAETYKVMMLSEISQRGRWDEFRRHIRATDAHRILDLLGA